MPRGKAKFSTTSPNDRDWPSDPEQAMENIAQRNNARYIKNSLVFATGGAVAEALFSTVEPGGDEDPTMLHRLGEELDAIQFSLYFDVDTWLAQQEAKRQQP